MTVVFMAHIKSRPIYLYDRIRSYKELYIITGKPSKYPERWRPYRGFGKAKGRLDLSEAPQAYKDIECVIDAERDLVEPLVRLVPIANLKG